MGLTPPGFSLGKLMVPLTAADYEAVFYRMPKLVCSKTAENRQTSGAPTSDTVLGQLAKRGASSNTHVEAPVAAVTVLQAGTRNNKTVSNT
jgi:hypothetical protein